MLSFLWSHALLNYRALELSLLLLLLLLLLLSLLNSALYNFPLGHYLKSISLLLFIYYLLLLFLDATFTQKGFYETATVSRSLDQYVS